MIASADLCSLGEQQRIAFARLLFHKPWLAFLDEATGALDIQTESHLYKTLQQQHQSYVSVGESQQSKFRASYSAADDG